MAEQRFRIAIVGAGISGFAAASVLRKRHDVTIYERNSEGTPEVGAGIGLGPNGTKMAKALGLSKEDIRGIAASGFKSFDKSENLVSDVQIDFVKSFGSEWWMAHRQDLKDALHRAALKPDGGRPVQTVYNSEIASVDPDSATITFANGDTGQFDMIIGADGIHSRVRKAVIGDGHPAPVPSNLSLYRFTLPMDEVRDALADHPNSLNYDDGYTMNLFVAADGTNRNIVVYPCRSANVVNFACAVPDSFLKGQTDYSCTMEGDVDEMVSHFQDFPAWFHSIMRKIVAVKIYQLHDQDPLPTYVKGHTILIGDAAHPMVPYQGQGANQALEDAEGLRLLLDPAVTKDTLVDVLQTWDSLRRPRASQVQLYSRSAGQKFNMATFMQRQKFNWTYDGIDMALAQATDTPAESIVAG